MLKILIHMCIAYTFSPINIRISNHYAFFNLTILLSYATRMRLNWFVVGVVVFVILLSYAISLS